MQKQSKHIIISAIFLILINILLDFPVFGNGHVSNYGSYIDSDSTDMYLFYEKAKQFSKTGVNDSAVYYGERALKVAEEYLNEEQKIDVLLFLADLYYNNNDIKYANKYLLTAENEIKKSDNLRKLYFVYFNIANINLDIKSYDKAIEYYNEAIEYFPPDIDSTTLYSIFSKMAFCYVQAGKGDKGVEVYKKQLDYLNSPENIKNKIMVLNELVDVNLKMKNYDMAIQYYTDIFDLYAELNNFKGMANSLNNIGYTYTLIENYSKAIQAFKGAMNIDFQLKLSDNEKAVALTNIGVCYHNMGKYDAAIKNLNESLSIYSKNNEYKKMAELQNMLALVYQNKGDLFDASLYSQKSIDDARKSNDPEILKLCYETYSNILQDETEYEEALEYYQAYLSIKDSMILGQQLKEQQLSQEQYLAEKTEKEIKLLFADQEMKDLALKKLKLESEKKEQEVQLLKREHELQESNLKKQELEKDKAVQDLAITQQKHESEKQDQAIKSLQQEKALQEAKLKQKDLEEKERERTIAFQKLALEKQNEINEKRRWMGVLFTLVFIIILVSFIITQKKNHKLSLQKKVIEEKNVNLQQMNEEVNTQKEHLQKANDDIRSANSILEQKTEEILAQNEELNQKNEEISLQKEVIEIKNQDITDSIHYARRIQNAVLPPHEIFDEILKDYFILFRPRDIVSGDFYWLRERDNKIVLVAADCTGHGVPGAFMSMLAVSLLNEIVNSRDFNDAADILNILRDEIKLSLRQTGKKGEAKDGLDCALCIIDKENMSMHYAGANNPLYLVRDGEIIYYKADRMPIGIYVRIEDSFTNNKIDLKPGDAIYVASDGYTDQFGGEFGKKFMTKNFKELLVELQDTPMRFQKEILSGRLREWMGDKHDQIDDILVIGFKVDSINS